MKPLLIRGGRIFDPARGVDEIGNMVIADGKIVWLGTGTPSQPYELIFEAKGLVVCPGFIDLHCHLRQPGFEEKETIATGTLAAARGGFTTVCCMPNTKPPLDNKVLINEVRSVAAFGGIVRVLPIGCITRGRQGTELADFAEMVGAGVIAVSDDGDPVTNSGLMRRALELARGFDLPVIDHCEDKSLTAGGQMNEGAVSQKLKLRGIPAVAEEIMVARDLALAELTGARVHIAHVSTAGSVELIRRAREKGVPVTAEVTPHHLTLTEERVADCNSNARVNPPLRTRRDVMALIQGLSDRVIDVIATDHAPHTEAEKRREFTQAPFGISGLETALGSLMSLVHGGHVTLDTIITALTSAPANIIGNKHGKLGTLRVGVLVDVTVFDLEREWMVNIKDFASKGKNTPLANTVLKGKVIATISRGEMVYIDKAVNLKERVPG